MQLANFRSCWCSCAACAGVGVPLACGMYFSHFCRAAVKARTLTETPLTEIVCPLASIRIRLLLRSGKFGTPLARMHLENGNAEPVELEPLPLDELDPEGRLDAVAELFATVGELEPQAAMIVVAASAAKAAGSLVCPNGCLR